MFYLFIYLFIFISLGLNTQGLYRISSAKSKMEKLCQLFEAGSERVDLSDLPPHLISSCLKLYFRQVRNACTCVHVHVHIIHVHVLYSGKLLKILNAKFTKFNSLQSFKIVVYMHVTYLCSLKLCLCKIIFIFLNFSFLSLF